MRRSLTLALAAAVVATPLPCLAKEVPLRFKQERDSNPVQALSAAEFATLGDPLFNLVLKTRADVTRVADVEKLIQPDIAKRGTFVVDERIASSAKPSSRRAVLTFEGATGGENLS